MNILLDADALVAIFKDSDSNHKKALLILKKHKNDFMYTTSFTVPETVTVISNKINQTQAKESLVKFRKEKFTEIFVTPQIIEDTDKIFLTQGKNGTSWIDCLNVAVYKKAKMDAIFSFDQFYKKLGLSML